MEWNTVLSENESLFGGVELLLRFFWALEFDSVQNGHGSHARVG